jgi:aldose 1-epimerase
MATITLMQGKWLVELSPQTGGSISRCDYDGQEMLRRASASGLVSGDARDHASFPLVPFSNRIENGVFIFDAERLELPRNMGDHPHTLHGHGWRGEWEVETQKPDSAVLVYNHEAGVWPWRYQATQQFSFSGDSFIVGLTVTNLGERAMPAGLGLHPYFARSEGVTLTTTVTHVWDATPQQIPIRRNLLPSSLDFSRGLKIADLNLDHCFAGWGKTAVIDWPGRRYRLHMDGDDNLGHLVVYTPKGEDFFCVEGVENMNNAFNWIGRGVETGARILAPGETHGIVTVFRAERSAP